MNKKEYYLQASFVYGSVFPGQRPHGLIDTEIAQQQTMLNYQEKLFVSHIKFLTDGVRIKNVKIANLVH